MNVLLVHDDMERLTLLKSAISQWSDQISTAGDGQQALEQLGHGDVDIVVSGWLTPELNIAQFCQNIRSLNSNRYVYILMVFDRIDHPVVVRSFESGLDDFVLEPVDPAQLQIRLEIGARVIKLERENNQKYLAIKKNYYQSLHMFTQLLESYNKDLGGHARRVGQFSLSLARKHPGILPEDYPIVEAAGLLHDIGLIGLPETLVTKSVPEMTGDEKKGYFAHPERGELILNQVDLLRPVAKLVRMHHEQANGRGFPDGLRENQIPATAAVVGAASVYDHLVHHRKIPLEQIPEQLQQYRGYQYSSQIIDLLLETNLEQMQAEAKRTFWEVEIEALQAGMILASDIRMRTGAFVMAANTCIDAGIIEKFRRYHELGNISGSIFIKK